MRPNHSLWERDTQHLTRSNPLTGTLSGGQVMGLCPGPPPFPAAEGGLINEECQSTALAYITYELAHLFIHVATL